MYKFYIKILVGKFDEPQPKFISQKYIMEVLHSEVNSGAPERLVLFLPTSVTEILDESGTS
jgi:hypothetical protein